MLYTRTGDGGTSGLFGTTERFAKDNAVYDALGTLDELNSLLGVCRARVGALSVARDILAAQQTLFVVQAELAGAAKRVTQGDVDALETTIGRLEMLIERPRGFVVPGANELSALFDHARAVCRRAERAVVGAARTWRVSPAARAYLNRLSSLLYVLARCAATAQGAEHRPTY